MGNGVTLKMLALCGRGGAGRDGDVVLTDGGWLGVDGPLNAALTDLEYKEEIVNNTSIIKVLHDNSNYNIKTDYTQ